MRPRYEDVVDPSRVMSYFVDQDVLQILRRDLPHIHHSRPRRDEQSRLLRPLVRDAHGTYDLVPTLQLRLQGVDQLETDALLLPVS